jgi:hypothetical protein
MGQFLNYLAEGVVAAIGAEKSLLRRLLRTESGSTENHDLVIEWREAANK